MAVVTNIKVDFLLDENDDEIAVELRRLIVGLNRADIPYEFSRRPLTASSQDSYTMVFGRTAIKAGYYYQLRQLLKGENLK